MGARAVCLAAFAWRVSGLGAPFCGVTAQRGMDNIRRELRLAENSMTNIYTWWDQPRTVPGRPCRSARQVRLFRRAARRANDG